MGERCRYRADRRGSRHELLLLTHSLGHLAPRQYLSMDVKRLKMVKLSHTRYRALGPELIPVYRQLARR